MNITVTNWVFASTLKCSHCGHYPEAAWDMAKVDGSWICTVCLGLAVMGMEEL